MKAIVTAALGAALVITVAACGPATHAAKSDTAATVTPAAAASTASS